MITALFVKNGKVRLLTISFSLKYSILELTTDTKQIPAMKNDFCRARF